MGLFGKESARVYLIGLWCCLGAKGRSEIANGDQESKKLFVLCRLNKFVDQGKGVHGVVVIVR